MHAAALRARAFGPDPLSELREVLDDHVHLGLEEEELAVTSCRLAPLIRCNAGVVGWGQGPVAGVSVDVVEVGLVLLSLLRCCASLRPEGGRAAEETPD